MVIHITLIIVFSITSLSLLLGTLNMFREFYKHKDFVDLFFGLMILAMAILSTGVTINLFNTISKS